jgi:hypothetical protein
MPPLDPAAELGASVEDAIVVVLVMYRSCDAVAEHAICKMRQLIHGIFSQEGCRRGRITFDAVVTLGGSELVELVLRYEI